MATAGDDGWLRLWDPEARREAAAMALPGAARAAAFSSDGARLAIGLGARLGG